MLDIMRQKLKVLFLNIFMKYKEKNIKYSRKAIHKNKYNILYNRTKLGTSKYVIMNIWIHNILILYIIEFINYYT